MSCTNYKYLTLTRHDVIVTKLQADEAKDSYPLPPWPTAHERGSGPGWLLKELGQRHLLIQETKSNDEKILPNKLEIPRFSSQFSDSILRWKHNSAYCQHAFQNHFHQSSRLALQTEIYAHKQDPSFCFHFL